MCVLRGIYPGEGVNVLPFRTERRRLGPGWRFENRFHNAAGRETWSRTAVGQSVGRQIAVLKSCSLASSSRSSFCHFVPSSFVPLYRPTARGRRRVLSAVAYLPNVWP